MRAVLCYCAVVWSQHRGELQHLVGHRSTCDWCNTWTESLCLRPPPPFQRWVLCPCVRGRNKDLARIGLRLVVMLPDFLAPLLSFSLSPYFSWEDKVTRQTWNSSRPHPWPPNPSPQAMHCILPKGGWWGQTVSSFPLFLWSARPPSLLFILNLLPFPETLHRNTCRGLNSVHCFQSSLPHLDSCGAGPCGCVSERDLDSFTVLSFHKCHRDPVMTREENIW